MGEREDLPEKWKLTRSRAKDSSATRTEQVLVPPAKRQIAKKALKISPFATGLAIGIWIALAQAFVGVDPPLVYGFCFLGHPSDLQNWLINSITGLGLYVRPVSLDIPVLTVIGVLAGAYMASKRHPDLSGRKRIIREPVNNYMIGFAAANFGLLLGHCPIYVAAATAYGSLLLAIGLGSIFVGVALAVLYVRWSVSR